MKLRGPQYEAFCDAIESAFPSQSEIEQAVRFGLGERLNTITSAGKLPQIAFELVGWAESHGRTAALLAALRRANPGNPALKAFAASYDSSAATTPTTDPETPTMPTPDLSTRTIHTDHARGVVHLLRETLTGIMPEEAATVRAYLFADDATYAELRDLSEEGARAAIKDALPGKPVPATRVTALVLAVRQVTPARRVCPTCGRLDLAQVAARWSPVSSEFCPADGSLYARVAFPADVIAWTDGRTYPPGTTHDDARLPITDAAIRAWAATHGGTLHAWTEDATRAEHVSLCDLARFLLRTHQTASPLATLDALANPRAAHLVVDALAMRALVRRVKETAPQAPTPPPEAERGEPTGTWDKDRRKALREALAELYSSVAEVATVASDAGVRTGNANLVGPIRDVWFNVIEEAGKHQLLDALYRRARQDYPRNPALVALAVPS